MLPVHSLAYGTTCGLLFPVHSLQYSAHAAQLCLHAAWHHSAACCCCFPTCHALLPFSPRAGEEGLVNAIGGCCGTSPEHIASIREMASAYPPRQRHEVPALMRLSGLEPLNYQPNAANMRETFLNIGERCNVAGSIIYKKAIVDGDYDKAVSIALSQVRAAATSGAHAWPAAG